MTLKLRRYSLLLLGVCCFWLAVAAPSQAHWADLATAEINISTAERVHNSLSAQTKADITLLYPTKLTAFADDDASDQLSDKEISRHRAQLQEFLGDRIQLKDGLNQPAVLTVGDRNDAVSPSGQAAPNTHTSLQLRYTWPTAVQGIEIDYNLFVQAAPQATCLATISQAGEFTSHVFTPEKTTLLLTPSGSLFSNSKWALTLIGVFAWGAAHSMSPGHGKTLVAAYLVGERATPLHAIFLATVTTVTHTIGVFALGLVTLFAARYILPEQLYPWLSLVSGCMVVAIGGNLLWQRWQRYVAKKSREPAHSYQRKLVRNHQRELAHSHHSGSTHHHSHSHDQIHSHGHSQPSHGEHSHSDHSHDNYSHGEHSHSHLPVSGEPVTWRSLLLLGFSAGLVPCPAALVLLLGAIAIGSPLSGLVLVLVFSLGLSVVLTVLGLLLVYAKQLFKRLPTAQMAWLRWLPMVSAAGIVVIGLGISTRSLLQVF